MAVARRCSECGGSLEGKAPSAKTCSTPCRQKRARRLRAANLEAQGREEEVLAAADEVRAIVRVEGDSVVRRIMKQELEPVVREAIDENVLEAIGAMVRLTPAAVTALQEDLEGDDPVLRQRAAALVVKYTVGHPALVKPADEKHEKLEIYFGLPRPDNAPAFDQDVVPRDAEEVEETRVCDICHAEKPASEFVVGSDRCQSCFESWRQTVLESLA